MRTCGSSSCLPAMKSSIAPQSCRAVRWLGYGISLQAGETSKQTRMPQGIGISSSASTSPLQTARMCWSLPGLTNVSPLVSGTIATIQLNLKEELRLGTQRTRRFGVCATSQVKAKLCKSLCHAVTPTLCQQIGGFRTSECRILAVEGMGLIRTVSL